ncbi:MAG: LacI family DNA-binding transcriptional regulator [Bryobacteraceae bacterium]|jgi:DNA-binding LacI/PurR family transcriptional regulator
MNLREVARRARVSTSTVSRVLNNTGPVKNSTRGRVMRAVAELKYHPNLHARSLAGGRSRTLGAIVSNLANPFFFDIFESLEAAALGAGYEVLVANTGYEPERLVSNIRLMIGRRVAGLAVVVSEMDPSLIQLLRDAAIPTVFYDVGTAVGNITNIGVNYRRGIEKVVEFLHTLGHARMAFIGHHAGLGPIGERQKTFEQTVSRYAPPVEFRTIAGSDSLEGGRQAARDLLDSGFQPTAIVCVNDFMAVGVLCELRTCGLRVPQDVSVTGFDNIRLSQFCSPALTTVHIPRDRIGAIAFECLCSDPGSPAGRCVVIDPEFIVRDSTAPAGAATRVTPVAVPVLL